MGSNPEQPTKNLLGLSVDYLKKNARTINGKELPRKMSPHRGNYASQQSIVVGDKRYGTCPRQNYYDQVHPELRAEAQAEDPLDQMAMFGEILNDVIVDMMRKLGVYITHEYEFAELDGYWSGRADIFCYYWNFDDQGNLQVDYSRMVVVENKTIQGFYGAKVCIWPDDGVFEPKKPEAVMQNALYVDKLVREGFPVAEGRIFYMARDSGETGTHYVNILYDEPTDSRRIIVNGMWYRGFTIEAINAESNKLKEAVDNKVIPPRAFQRQYPKKKMLKLLHSDLLNQKDTKSMQKDQLTIKGDNQCTYCPFQEACWKGITIINEWNDEDNTYIEFLGTRT